MGSMNKLAIYKRKVFIGIILIAMGVVLRISLSGQASSLGNVILAIGGLFLVIAMNEKKKEAV
jgi:hypothetical protein